MQKINSEVNLPSVSKIPREVEAVRFKVESTEEHTQEYRNEDTTKVIQNTVFNTAISTPTLPVEFDNSCNAIVNNSATTKKVEFAEPTVIDSTSKFNLALHPAMFNTSNLFKSQTSSSQRPRNLGASRRKQTGNKGPDPMQNSFFHDSDANFANHNNQNLPISSFTFASSSAPASDSMLIRLQQQKDSTAINTRAQHFDPNYSMPLLHSTPTGTLTAHMNMNINANMNATSQSSSRHKSRTRSHTTMSSNSTSAAAAIFMQNNAQKRSKIDVNSVILSPHNLNNLNANLSQQPHQFASKSFVPSGSKNTWR
jgi:hypothetical protein